MRVPLPPTAVDVHIHFIRLRQQIPPSKKKQKQKKACSLGSHHPQHPPPPTPLSSVVTKEENLVCLGIRLSNSICELGHHILPKHATSQR